MRNGGITFFVRKFFRLTGPKNLVRGTSRCLRVLACAWYKQHLKEMLTFLGRTKFTKDKTVPLRSSLELRQNISIKIVIFPVFNYLKNCQLFKTPTGHPTMCCVPEVTKNFDKILLIPLICTYAKKSKAQAPNNFGILLPREQFLKR